MTELELIDVLNRFFDDGIELSAATYFIAALISLISGGAGAYFSSYLKKSGELKAVSEKLESTLTQLQRQTKVVEEVKGRLANQVWIDKQRWEFRKEIFLELMSLLLKIKNECEKAEIYLDRIPRLGAIEDDDEYEAERKRMFAEAEKIYDGEVKKLTEELKVLLNEKGLLFLSDEVIQVLRLYFDAEKIRRAEVRREFENDLAAGRVVIDDAGSVDNYEWSLYHKSEAAEQAYVMVVKAAKTDLKIKETTF